MAMPTKDTLLVPWGSNFDTKVTASPVTYALSAPQALSFHTAYAAYLAAYNLVATARQAGTRSELLTANKDDAKKSLLQVGRELYGIVQDAIGVSDGNKLDIGVTPRNTAPSPQPAPSIKPGITVLSTDGNNVTIRVFDPGDPARRGKPSGVSGIGIYTAVAPTAPTVEDDWTFQGITGKTRTTASFPSTVQAGSKVWFTCFYFSNAKKNGPAADPVGINLPGGSAMAV